MTVRTTRAAISASLLTTRSGYRTVHDREDVLRHAAKLAEKQE
jgi:hypothetical protein